MNDDILSHGCLQEDGEHLKSLKSLKQYIFCFGDLRVNTSNSSTAWQFILPEDIRLEFEECHGCIVWSEIRCIHHPTHSFHSKNYCNEVMNDRILVQLNGQLFPIGDTHAGEGTGPDRYNIDQTTGHRQYLHFDCTESNSSLEVEEEDGGGDQIVRSIFRSFNERQEDDEKWVELTYPSQLLELILGGSMKRAMEMWQEKQTGNATAPPLILT